MSKTYVFFFFFNEVKTSLHYNLGWNLLSLKHFNIKLQYINHVTLALEGIKRKANQV